MAHLWLRSEYKSLERRTPLIPKHAQQLVACGHHVTVEEALQRAFSIEDYRKAGCEIVPAGMWQYAPHDAYILGLKNLPDAHESLRHRHIYFAHSFKEQLHSKWLLRRFRKGGGILYDLEYLVDENKRRVAAFGNYAGIAGAAIALMIWALKMKGEKAPFTIPYLYMNENEMIKDIYGLLNSLDEKPSVLIIGSKGRCGLGANYFVKQFDISAVHWSREHTKREDINKKILTFDILLNCVFVDETTPQFLSKQDLVKSKKKLSVISDISCELDSKYNPLPFYTKTTNFENPTQKIGDVDLIAIDNLPSYLPMNSSIHFSIQLITHLYELLNGNIQNTVWKNAVNIFNQYSMNYIIENRMVEHYENADTEKHYNYC